MNLTDQQIQSLATGTPVPIVIGGTRCILIREDVFDRVKKVIEYDSSEIDPEEAYPAILEAWHSVGSPDDAKYQ
jgi:hypothetical protein